MEEVTRKSGLSAGKSDVYYFRYYTNVGLAKLMGAQDDEFADVTDRSGGGGGGAVVGIKFEMGTGGGVCLQQGDKASQASSSHRRWG